MPSEIPAASAAVDVVPLGGLGEFGMNMMLVACGDTAVVIDAGVMFPEPELFGVDLVIPDLSALDPYRGRIAALVLTTQFGMTWADPAFGAAIALYIVWSAWQIIRQSLDQLMDRELPDDARQRIRAVVLAHPEVRSVHDLRTRAAGRDIFIQFHIELDPSVTLVRAHEVSDAVEARVREAFPAAEIIIHQDPEGIEEPRPRFR